MPSGNEARDQRIRRRRNRATAHTGRAGRLKGGQEVGQPLLDRAAVVVSKGQDGSSTCGNTGVARRRWSAVDASEHSHVWISSVGGEHVRRGVTRTIVNDDDLESALGTIKVEQLLDGFADVGRAIIGRHDVADGRRAARELAGFTHVRSWPIPVSPLAGACGAIATAGEASGATTQAPAIDR